MSRKFAVSESAGIKPSVLLRAAAKLVDRGQAKTICEALHNLLPGGMLGDQNWHLAKVWLSFLLPEGGFERPWGWWASRKDRVLGALLAAAIAESEGL